MVPETNEEQLPKRHICPDFPVSLVYFLKQHPSYFTNPQPPIKVPRDHDPRACK